MTTIITEYQTHKPILKYDCGVDFRIQTDIEEHTEICMDEGFAIEWQRQWFDGLHISFVHISATHPVAFDVRHSENCIGLLYCIDGLLNNHADQVDTKLEKAHFFACNQSPLHTFQIPNAVSLVYIQLSHLYYLQITGQTFASEHFNYQGQQITPEMGFILKDIKTHRYSGRLKRMFLHAKIVDLLILHLSNYHRTPGFSLKEDDMKKIQYARQLVEEDIQKPASLIELSRKAGINDYKLKKGFKQLTGETVFGYLYELRMKKAYAYLVEEKKAVNEVAYLVGYKNPQHFIAAFKRKFQTPPGKMNRFKNLAQTFD